jgi:hypothetical protein
MKTIPLTRGYFTKVDDDDYEKYASVRWHVCPMKKGAKALRSTFVNGKKTTTYLSRVIMNAPKGKQVDHINHDTLDNRKCNLRVCTREQNNANQNISKNNTSGYKGVCWHIRLNKWQAKIGVNMKRITLGSFNTKEEAALAYNKGAKKYFGEFACLNKL